MAKYTLQTVFTILILLTSVGKSQDLTIVGYNVEFGDADPGVVAQRIEEIDGCDIWGLSEVQNNDLVAMYAHL
jgi:hypothetical protein